MYRATSSGMKIHEISLDSSKEQTYINSNPSKRIPAMRSAGLNIKQHEPYKNYHPSRIENHFPINGLW
jgi:hypothetical protein